MCVMCSGGRSKRQDATVHRPLAGKTIFLDVPGFRGVSSLEEDLKRLGGVSYTGSLNMVKE